MLRVQREDLADVLFMFWVSSSAEEEVAHVWLAQRMEAAAGT